VNARLDLGHHWAELWTGPSQGLSGTTHPPRVGAIELNPMVRCGEGQAMKSRDGPRCAADRLDGMFGIPSLKYFWQTWGLHFVLHKDPIVREIGN